MKKTVLLFLTLLVSLPTVASPVRNMVAAKSLMATDSSEKWVNPYVTDGLVAMWDGEWNARGGVHTDGSYLVDLVSGEHIDYPEGCSNTGSSFRLQGTASSGVMLKSAITGIVRGTSPFTLEVVLHNHNSSVPTGGNEAGIGYGRSLGVRTGRYINSRPANESQARFFNLSFTGSPAITEKCSLSYAYQSHNSSTTVVRNGVRSSPAISSYYSMSLTVDGFLFLKCADKNQDIEYFTVRAYSRALTAEEIAHNYAVDKERFGL